MYVLIIIMLIMLKLIKENKQKNVLKIKSDLVKEIIKNNHNLLKIKSKNELLKISKKREFFKILIKNWHRTDANNKTIMLIM